MPTEKKSIITKETLVPLGALVIIVGGVFWIANMWFQVQSNTRDIEILTKSSDDLLDRMARIETKIDLLLQKEEK